jgi:hypothetical protein
MMASCKTISSSNIVTHTGKRVKRIDQSSAGSKIGQQEIHAGCWNLVSKSLIFLTSYRLRYTAIPVTAQAFMISGFQRRP